MSEIPEGLPPHAQRAFKGEIWEIWQWEQVQFDGSITMYDRAIRTDSVTAIPLVGDRILIQHQEQPFRGSFISLPGGFREADDPLDDAKRELLEESGYASERWVHYLSWSPPASKLIWKNHFYIAHDCKKIQEMIPDPGEKITLVFIDFDTFLLMADNPTWRHRDLVPTLLRARYEPDKRRALEEALFG